MSAARQTRSRRKKGIAPAVLRLRLAFDLYQAGEDMMRLRLRRRYPRAADAEIERRLGEWLRTRPGAELGDAEGVAIAWPRRD